MLTTTRSHALNTLKALQDIHIPHLGNVVWDDQKVDPPQAMPWYPDNLGNIARTDCARIHITDAS